MTDKFSAADVCVSLWLALALQKCKISEVPEQASGFLKSVLNSIKSYEKSISSLISGLAGGAPAAGSGGFSDNALVQKVNEFGLEHEVYSHPACMSAEELVANVPLASDKETHTKNLFFKDKKHGLFLVTHATASTFNTKQLGKLLKLEGKVNMRLAANDLLDQYLKVQPGCVGPLCIVNDTSKEVKLVLDKAIMDYDYVHSHPLQNDASVKMTPAALMEYMSKAGIEPVIVDFTVDPPAGDEGGKAPANRPPESKKAPKAKQEKQQKQDSKQNKKTAKKGRDPSRPPVEEGREFPHVVF